MINYLSPHPLKALAGKTGRKRSTINYPLPQRLALTDIYIIILRIFRLAEDI